MRTGGGFRGGVRGRGSGMGGGRGRGLEAPLGRLSGARLPPAAAAREVAASRPEALQGRRRMVAVVLQERCAGCGRCIEACLEQALSLRSTAAVDPSRCAGCGRCLAECPNEALLLGRRPSVGAEGSAG